MNKDLIILVADVQQEKTIETLLDERYKSLNIRRMTYDIFRHPRKDPGVYKEAAHFLKSYQGEYEHALVLLDSEWAGAPGDAVYLRGTLQQQLYNNGWNANNAEVIVIDPELEIWIWSDSPVVAEELRKPWNSIYTLAQKRGDWLKGQPKPIRPKELLDAILRQQNRPRSSAIFQAIARRVGLTRCQDKAFILLRQTVQNVTIFQCHRPLLTTIF